MEAMCTERVQRDVRTFTALIAAYGNGGQWEWAEAAFDVMQKAEVQPNANTFTALVTAYGKGGQWELAEAAIAAMKELNLQTESNPVLTLPALLKRVCAVSCATRQPSPIRAPLSLWCKCHLPPVIQTLGCLVPAGVYVGAPFPPVAYERAVYSCATASHKSGPVAYAANRECARCNPLHTTPPAAVAQLRCFDCVAETVPLCPALRMLIS